MAVPRYRSQGLSPVSLGRGGYVDARGQPVDRYGRPRRAYVAPEVWRDPARDGVPAGAGADGPLSGDSHGESFGQGS